MLFRFYIALLLCAPAVGLNIQENPTSGVSMFVADTVSLANS